MRGNELTPPKINSLGGTLDLNERGPYGRPQAEEDLRDYQRAYAYGNNRPLAVYHHASRHRRHRRSAECARRGVARANDGVLSFITDLRSPKAKEICAQPLVNLSGYEANSSVQLRVAGRARINTDEERRKKFWNGLLPHTHLLFWSPLAPGAIVSAPEDLYTEVELLNGDSAKLYAHFGLVDVIVDCIDWLDLSTEPPVRCRFARTRDGWEASWLAP